MESGEAWQRREACDGKPTGAISQSPQLHRTLNDAAGDILCAAAEVATAGDVLITTTRQTNIQSTEGSRYEMMHSSELICALIM